VSEPESAARTIGVAVAVALGCSLIVSASVTWLRPIQLAKQLADRDLSVLVAAGIVPDASALERAEIIDHLLALERRLVDLDSGSYVNADANMVAAYDYRAAIDDPMRSRAIEPSLDLASIGRRPLLMPVYLRYDDATIERVVLPMYGRGMWSTIHLFLVLDASLTRIVKLYIVEHGETPGIGDRIESADWLARWPGKRAYGDDGSVILRIGGSPNDPNESRVDGITGATVTVSALDDLVRYWLGEDGFGPFLRGLRQGA